MQLRQAVTDGSEDLVQLSQRGKQYLETARTLLRTAKTMTDQAIAGQLKVLAEDYQRRAEKALRVDAAKARAFRNASYRA
jgi:hypothetical protein